jgi:hypothetical protein
MAVLKRLKITSLKEYLVLFEFPHFSLILQVAQSGVKPESA